MKLLNLGCGIRYRQGWTNVDFVPSGESVFAYNLLKGIPFPDNEFDFVYHSHVLEHFPRKEAFQFISECARVLKPGGCLRVVVPDLEKITRTYLSTLAYVIDNPLSDMVAADVEWMTLLLYDQATRTISGGDMISFLRNEQLLNKDFVVKQCGSELKNIIDQAERARKLNPAIKHAPRSFFHKIVHLFKKPQLLKEKLIRNLLGSEYQALQIGRFRMSGEVHQWMYDQYSLGKLMKQVGLVDIQKKDAHESSLPDWASFNLDTEPNGEIYKPESLFLESIKPS